MRVVATYVVKNEAGRWFERSLESVEGVVDDIFVLDDQSSDATVELARAFTDHVEVRPHGVPSFEENEGQVRQYAWDRMAERFALDNGDLVVALDADEVLDCRVSDVATYRVLKANADSFGIDGWRVPILEVWGFDGDVPMVRIDGYWGDISGIRLVRYLATSRFKMGAASGSTPVPTNTEDAFGIRILHLGYANPEDRQRKYEFYTSHSGFNHNPRHIQSILAKPSLRRVSDG